MPARINDNKQTGGQTKGLKETAALLIKKTDEGLAPQCMPLILANYADQTTKPGVADPEPDFWIGSVFEKMSNPE